MRSKIEDIEVIVLRFEYPSGLGFHFAGGYCNARLSCLVRVRSDDGTEGIGSVYSHPELVRMVIEGHLKDILIGEDVDEIERLWEKCYTVTRWYGRKGVAISAIGGVDIALWDIRGKRAKTPVHRLLGSTRDSVPAYASALLWEEEPTALGRQAARLLDKGFNAVKLRLGRSYEYDCEALQIVREAIGQHALLNIECNARYNLCQINRIAPEFRRHKAHWVEEPFPPEDQKSLWELRPALGIPIAAGENEFGVQGFREIIDAGLIDVAQPDCSRSGGITECRRIALLAEKRRISIATHSWSDAIAIMANMHLVASLPNGVTIEVDNTGNALVDELLADPLQVQDGYIHLPDQPGLGIELNGAALRKYTYPRGVPLLPGNYSDLVFGRDYYMPAEPYPDLAA